MHWHLWLPYYNGFKHLKRSPIIRARIDEFFTCSVRRCADEKDDKKKKIEELVAVVDSNNKILGVKNKNEAARLALKKNLRLVKWEGPSAPVQKFPVYKLTTSSQLLQKQFVEEETRQRQRAPLQPSSSQKEVADSKRLVLTAKIDQHDLEVKLRNAHKWLEKRHPIHVLVAGEEGKERVLESIFAKVEESMKDRGRILQKRIKNGNLKFTIETLPNK